MNKYNISITTTICHLLNIFIYLFYFNKGYINVSYIHLKLYKI